MSAMTQRETSIFPSSKREQERAAMLKAALSRPGIREVMKVYHDWQEKDRGIDAYRSAVKEPEQVTTTNHTSAC